MITDTEAVRFIIGSLKIKEKNYNTGSIIYQVQELFNLMKKHKGAPLNDEPFEEVMASDLPKVYIHDVVDNPDETCSITFDTNKAFDDLYKKEKNRKRVSKKGVGEFFIELLKKGLDKEDGYDLKALKQIEAEENSGRRRGWRS